MFGPFIVKTDAQGPAKPMPPMAQSQQLRKVTATMTGTQSTSGMAK
jgi:hypothetical protein